jgi:hypothetical protein
MPQHVITRRFRSRARIITAAALGAAVVVLLGGALAIAASGGPRDGILVAYLVAALAIVGLIVSFAAITSRHAVTMRAVALRHPGDVVFLARRLPPVVSDMPAFLRSKGLDVQIGDGWYTALADRRGVSVHSPGRDPRELVLIEWSEIGELTMVRTATVGGDSRWSVTVDVKPYAVPLTVDVGSAAGIVTMALDAVDTTAVVKAVEARRP